MTYIISGNMATYVEDEETWEVAVTERCEIVQGGGEEYLLTDEYVFNGSIVLFNLDSKHRPKYMNPQSFQMLGDGYSSDGKLVFLRENFVCSAYGAKYIGSGYLTTNTKIFYWGSEETYLVKRLGCNPKSTKVIEERILRDDKATYEHINAWKEPWAVIKSNS